MKIALVGEAILTQPAVEVSLSELHSKPFADFVALLQQTMLKANGIGIAAPQVFDPRAVMIIASRKNPRYPDAPDMSPLLMINPQITEHSETQVSGWEGCLSVPGLRGNIKRYTWVKVKFINRLGEEVSQVFEGFVARIFQHEFDHLIGKTWLDQVESTADIMAETLWLERIAAQ